MTDCLTAVGNTLSIPESALQNIATGVDNVQKAAIFAAKASWNGFVVFIRHAKNVTNTNDSLENAIRSVHDTIVAVDLIRYSEPVVRPMLDQFQKYRNTISVIRIFSSVNYFVSGKCLEDLRDLDGHMFISNVGFLLARSGVVLNWLVEHNVLADLSANWGNSRFFSSAAKLKNVPWIDIFFIVGLGGIASKNLERMFTGQAEIFHVVDFISLGADITLTVLTIIGITYQPVCLTLAIVAASTGVGAFVLNPDNDKA